MKNFLIAAALTLATAGSSFAMAASHERPDPIVNGPQVFLSTANSAGVTVAQVVDLAAARRENRTERNR